MDSKKISITLFSLSCLLGGCATGEDPTLTIQEHLETPPCFDVYPKSGDNPGDPFPPDQIHFNIENSDQTNVDSRPPMPPKAP